VKALFLFNDRAGKRRGFDVREVIRGACAWEHEIAPCSRLEDTDAIIDRAEQENFDVVFAVGGDGTVHETAKRLVGRRVALGILPIGSGNGFARHIGLPMSPAEAIRSCRGGRIVTVDTAAANGIPFLGVMGIGLDAEIAARFASSTVRGFRTYLRVGMSAFAETRAAEYEITINGSTIRKKAMVVAIANSGHYGNNAVVAPLASLTDGLLDVVIVDEQSLAGAILLMGRLLMRTFHRSKAVTTIKTTAVTVRRAAPGAVHLDGEPFTMAESVQVDIRPQSLRLLVPDHVERF
jgi:YegS/Rv2252/BmrU family lipid kinase